MCQGPEMSKSTPASIRANSTLSYSSDGDLSDVTPERSLEASNDDFETESRHLLPTAFAGVSLAAGMLGFGLWLPFVAVPEASTNTYKWAFWSYDKSLSHFDNSVWTYGTDYCLAVVMGSLAYSILKLSQKGNTDRLSTSSASLLLLYMISVTAGGIAHQNYTTLESRNTLEFRLLWTICVGTVSLASTSMGMCGSEIVRKFRSERRCPPGTLFDKVPHIPELFWWVYGICITAFTAWGGMSFQRPACDIFIAGATQTPPTFYMMVVLFFLNSSKVEFKMRLFGVVGFIWNAALLPMYPMLVQYSGWSLGAVNTLLHCWLTVAWSMQGYSMRYVIQTLTTTTTTKEKKTL